MANDADRLVPATKANFDLFPFIVITQCAHTSEDVDWALETFGENGGKFIGEFRAAVMIDADCRWIHMPISASARFKSESDAILFKLRFG